MFGKHTKNEYIQDTITMGKVYKGQEGKNI